MTKNEILDKLQQVVSKEPVKWLEDSDFRLKNKKWLRRSQSVALKVLRTLRAEGLSQKELAERMNVSPQQVNKWLKGKENFTFETIQRLEDALNIELMSVVEPKCEPRMEVFELVYDKRSYIQFNEAGRSASEIKCIPLHPGNLAPSDHYLSNMKLG